MNLPQAFIDYTSALFGPQRWEHFVRAFNEPAPVSIRLNPFKHQGGALFAQQTPVPWCQHAYWLSERPAFTRDPLFHAGVYYVQEAGSCFLDTVLRQHVPTPVSVLDLCAAPGGKSTLLRAALPPGSLLVSNEPDRRRANILLENMLKQGHPDVLVTHNLPHEFAHTHLAFDVILADVPCSGEGLFRRDENAVGEWSLPNVHFCQERQRKILKDIWPCLRTGGLLIYSTCTFNVHENEENVRWILQELGAEILPVSTPAQWNITGSLLSDFDAPVYRFIPGITRTEGLFMAVLRKTSEGPARATLPNSLREQAKKHRILHILSDGTCPPDEKGNEKIPSAAQALSIAQPTEKYPRVELSLDQAQRYLHREAFALPPDTPRGFVLVTYQGYPLGFMKNLGDRANNLYPKNWAIKKL
ncbi:MAG: rRNA cytosine-C5-methyltransferase [Elusimicrobiaceae bacterium]|nr:rRNA cytosine-C5-methyltransferase [Elusimicrobiaceae bacterium]